jgi:hypothetical protein
MSETPIPSTIETVAAIMLGIPSIADQNAVRFMGGSHPAQTAHGLSR